MVKENKPSGGRANIAALIAVAIVVAALLWVANAVVAHNALQNCVDSGRRTCLEAGTAGTP